MVGYYNNPEATNKSFWFDEDGQKWMYTGDVGYVDENENLYLVDRIKEMIKYKGHQVWAVGDQILVYVFSLALINRPDT